MGWNTSHHHNILNCFFLHPLHNQIRGGRLMLYPRINKSFGPSNKGSQVTSGPGVKLLKVSNYVEQVLEVVLVRIDGVKILPHNMSRLMIHCYPIWLGIQRIENPSLDTTIIHGSTPRLE
ncbi:hypothetical protein KSP39_PZI021494 [Platanthera zijinensis]|uniref:Uncharacterized protein n=1 Tax=Platanthera zijinensis TaxID=2320716 RepID=A0AAP0FWR5_9ASPA